MGKPKEPEFVASLTTPHLLMYRALGLRSISLVRLILWTLMSFGAVVIVHRLFFPPSPSSPPPSPSSSPPSPSSSPPSPSSLPLFPESFQNLMASNEANGRVSQPGPGKENEGISSRRGDTATAISTKRSEPRMFQLLGEVGQAWKGAIGNGTGKVGWRGAIGNGTVKVGWPWSLPTLAPEIASKLKEIDRLSRERQKRPATAEDISATLAQVRRLRGDFNRTSRVLLVSTWRSGSTFLGQTIASHPGVFYHYEPLGYHGVKRIRANGDPEVAASSVRFLEDLLRCRYGNREYLEYSRKYAEDMLGHNKVVWLPCTKGPNRNTCFNRTFLEEACRLFPVHLVKLVRLDLALVERGFLSNDLDPDLDPDLKVIYLVRDPRATMRSRFESVKWCRSSPDCIRPEVLCRDLDAELTLVETLKVKRPDRFLMVKYEDIARHPIEKIEEIFEFLKLDLNAELRAEVSASVTTNVDAPWSTRRVASKRVDLWMRDLQDEDIRDIQKACSGVLRRLGYSILDLAQT